MNEFVESLIMVGIGLFVGLALLIVSIGIVEFLRWVARLTK